MATSKAPSTFASFVCHSCRQRLLPITSRRAFNTTTARHAEADPFGSPNSSNTSATPRTPNPFGAPSPTQSRSTSNRRKGFNDALASRPAPGNNLSIEDALDGKGDYNSLFSEEFGRNLDAASAESEAVHKMYVLATKHNTHITFVQPPRPAAETVGASSSGTSSADQKRMVDVLLSVSAGNIGFRKAGRGSYDAAFQLAAFTLKQIQERGMLRDIKRMEVILRGFGAGREAVTKALLGTEGRNIRNRIVRVVDATRLKFGGTRSKKPRRLG